MGGNVCTRRRFCAGGAAGLIVLGAGCTRANDGAALPGWGPSGSGGDSPDLGSGANPDLAQASASPDFGGHPPDLAHASPDFAQASPDFAQASPDFSTGNPDLGWTPPDLAQRPPDLAQAAGCGSGTVNAGAASSYAINQTRRFTGSTYDLHVCRDAGGLFAVDSTCPHAGCTVTQRTSGWYCPCHGATFALDGTQPTSPAFSPLPCYAVCVDGNGTVWVDPNTTVDPSTRA